MDAPMELPKGNMEGSFVTKLGVVLFVGVVLGIVDLLWTMTTAPVESVDSSVGGVTST